MCVCVCAVRACVHVCGCELEGIRAISQHKEPDGQGSPGPNTVRDCTSKIIWPLLSENLQQRKCDITQILLIHKSQ